MDVTSPNFDENKARAADRWAGAKMAFMIAGYAPVRKACHAL
ncbi:hypothetical protein [Pseudidiomarina sediminum]|nr:hypothetical protein [Pseudidiomarina sediminum]